MIKLFVEFGPIIVFLVTYKYSDILMATKLMIIVTLFCLMISYLIDRKLSVPLMLSALILIVSGSVTLLTGDPKYIKMKPTIVYLIFSVALYIGAIKNKPIIKDVLGSVISMQEEYWISLSTRFALYFLGMALINEIVWRNFSEDMWVNFKVFGALPITLIFVAMQIPFILRNQITDDNKQI
jgi:intracellular septation protein